MTDENLNDACDEIEETMKGGGVVLDYASCDYFPERWFDLVVVLRTEIDALAPRLVARDYADNKVQENIQAEIFQVVEDDARELYPNIELVVLPSNTTDQMQSNIEQLAAYISSYSSS